MYQKKKKEDKTMLFSMKKMFQKIQLMWHCPNS